jgi:hypothetical protein
MAYWPYQQNWSGYPRGNVPLAVELPPGFKIIEPPRIGAGGEIFPGRYDIEGFKELVRKGEGAELQGLLEKGKQFFPALEQALSTLSQQVQQGQMLRQVVFSRMSEGGMQPHTIGSTLRPTFPAPQALAAATTGTVRVATLPRHIAPDIAGVTIEFEPGADKPIDARLASQFESAVALTKMQVPGLRTLYVSSSVRSGTLHQHGWAIDVSRVNGIRVVGGYGTVPVVTNVVQSLQAHMASMTYENYGPAFMWGPGSSNPLLREQHRTHMHFGIKPGYGGSK